MGSSKSGQPPYRIRYSCSYCGKGNEEVRRLIAGPGAVYICDECVERYRENLIHEEIDHPPVVSTPGTDLAGRCSFCGKHEEDVRRLITSATGVVICDECLDLCWEIIEEEPPDE